MTATDLYPASPINPAADPYPASPINPKRRRATQDEMEERAEFLISYAKEHGPVTVRQLYYACEVHGIAGIDKTENGYSKVQHQVLMLRREGRLPYYYITDGTRHIRKPYTCNSIEEAIRDTAEFYRKRLWRDSDTYVELWLEKDALAGVVYPVTSEYDVPLMVTRGFSSETFCYNAIEAREGDDRDYLVLYLGDFDRSGQDAAHALKDKLERFGDEADVTVTFETLAIAPGHIKGQQEGLVSVHLQGRPFLLPTREPKRKCPADKAWPYQFAVELDAIPPDAMRWLVRDALEVFMPAAELKVLKTAEESERGYLKRLAETMVEAAERDGGRLPL